MTLSVEMAYLRSPPCLPHFTSERTQQVRDKIGDFLFPEWLILESLQGTLRVFDRGGYFGHVTISNIDLMDNFPLRWPYVQSAFALTHDFMKCTSGNKIFLETILFLLLLDPRPVIAQGIGHSLLHHLTFFRDSFFEV